MGRSSWSIAHLGAVAVGVVYVIFGLVGFGVTGFGSFVQDTPDDLLGYDLNPFHNVVHFTIGAYLLFAATLSRPVVEGAMIGGGAVYLVAVFLGFTNALEIISINSSGAAVNFLHLISGSAALAIGVVSAATDKSEADSRPRGNVLKQRR